MTPQQQQLSTPSATSNPSATIEVKIAQFYPIGSIYPVASTLTLTAGDPRVFKFDGESLVITVPSGTALAINYQLNDPRYVLLGIAFNPNGPGAGRQEFPQVVLNRTPAGSTMSVTDQSLQALEGVIYNYVILVQEVASGSIGIIDPEIENQPE